jgi:hypothetical protein
MFAIAVASFYIVGALGTAHQPLFPKMSRLVMGFSELLQKFDVFL